MSVFGIEISYGVGGGGAESVQSFAVAMERFGEEISHFGTHVFPRVTSLFEAAIDAQFDARGKGPIAGGWPALTPEYARWKDEHYPGAPLLERTQKMRDALTKSGASGARRETSDAALVFGTIGVEYASVHQMGRKGSGAVRRAARKILSFAGISFRTVSFMPARPPIDFGHEFDAELQKAMQLGVVDAARAARMPDGEVT